MPQDPTVDFHPLYKLTIEELGSFKTEYKLTEDEVKSLEYAEGVAKDGIFYITSALIEGEYYNAD